MGSSPSSLSRTDDGLGARKTSHYTKHMAKHQSRTKAAMATQPTITTQQCQIKNRIIRVGWGLSLGVCPARPHVTQGYKTQEAGGSAALRSSGRFIRLAEPSGESHAAAQACLQSVMTRDGERERALANQRSVTTTTFTAHGHGYSLHASKLFQQRAKKKWLRLRAVQAASSN